MYIVDVCVLLYFLLLYKSILVYYINNDKFNLCRFSVYGVAVFCFSLAFILQAFVQLNSNLTYFTFVPWDVVAQRESQGQKQKRDLCHKLSHNF